ncbi:hypothetical protein FA15DRAFT_659830 [Coprinopsis marcescibilis]|uniref:Uncharacterized protein n=1 Tax=Coprinopsis marcescibilis TaxID=230819 RepID=A0A5C3KH80_COPMA|nr:hypothetical protein FA15DRAFT_659830 [Coprinopsis marcescibilis]
MKVFPQWLLVLLTQVRLRVACTLFSHWVPVLQSRFLHVWLNCPTNLPMPRVLLHLPARMGVIKCPVPTAHRSFVEPTGWQMSLVLPIPSTWKYHSTTYYLQGRQDQHHPCLTSLGSQNIYPPSVDPRLGSFEDSQNFQGYRTPSQREELHYSQAAAYCHPAQSTSPDDDQSFTNQHTGTGGQFSSYTTTLRPLPDPSSHSTQPRSHDAPPPITQRLQFQSSGHATPSATNCHPSPHHHNGLPISDLGRTPTITGTTPAASVYLASPSTPLPSRTPSPLPVYVDLANLPASDDDDWEEGGKSLPSPAYHATPLSAPSTTTAATTPSQTVQLPTSAGRFLAEEIASSLGLPALHPQLHSDHPANLQNVHLPDTNIDQRLLQSLAPCRLDASVLNQGGQVGKNLTWQQGLQTNCLSAHKPAVNLHSPHISIRIVSSTALSASMSKEGLGLTLPCFVTLLTNWLISAESLKVPPDQPKVIHLAMAMQATMDVVCLGIQVGQGGSNFKLVLRLGCMRHQLPFGSWHSQLWGQLAESPLEGLRVALSQALSQKNDD